MNIHVHYFRGRLCGNDYTFTHFYPINRAGSFLKMSSAVVTANAIATATAVPTAANKTSSLCHLWNQFWFGVLK